MDRIDTALDHPEEQWRFKEGDEVYSADDETLGKIIAFVPDTSSPTHLMVEQGALFHTDWYIPVAAVTSYDGERLYVDATREEARQPGRRRHRFVGQRSRIVGRSRHEQPDQSRRGGHIMNSPTNGEVVCVGARRPRWNLWFVVALLFTLVPIWSGPVAAQDEDDTAATAASVRVVHAAPDAPALDVVVAEQTVGEGLAFGTASTYQSVSPGEHPVQVALAGEAAGPLIDTTVDLGAGEAYILTVLGRLAEIELTVNEVRLDAVDPGMARLRLIHAAPEAGPVDVLLDATEFFSGVGFPDDTSYIDLVAGAYDVEVTEADAEVGAPGDGIPATPTGILLVSEPGLEFLAGTVTDLVLLGPVGDGGLALLPLVTPVAGLCFALLGVGTPNDACVRVVHAAADIGAIDLHVDDTAVAQGLAFGDASDFVPLPVGEEEATLRVTTAETPPAAEEDGDDGTAFDPKPTQAYQVVVVGPLEEDAEATIDAVSLVVNEIDQTPLPEGQARLRVVHAARGLGGVDVAVAGGPVLFEGVDPGEATSYAVIDAGQYALDVRVTDDEGAVMEAAATLDAGMVYDAIVLGEVGDEVPAVLLLAALASLRIAEEATPVTASLVAAP